VSTLVDMMEHSTTEEQPSKIPSASSTRTRRSRAHPIFGSPAQLSTNVLPTIGQVVRYFVYLKDSPNAPNKAVFGLICDAVMNILQRVSLPTVQRWSIIKRISVIINKGCKLSRSKTSTNMKKHFTSSFCNLFDICSCSCKISTDVLSGELVALCHCSRQVKVSARELKFLHDQRTVRQMFIGGIDVAVTQKNMKLVARKAAQQNREAKERLRKIKDNQGISQV
jgi:hypothetical protein